MKDKLGAGAASTPLREDSSSLIGQLIPFNAPDREGWWAYRILLDGTMLETELTEKEWDHVETHALLHPREFSAVLNRHQLNQAAKRRLERERQRPIGNDMYILELGHYVLPEADPHDLGVLLAGSFMELPTFRFKVLEVLADAIGEDEVEHEPLDKVLDGVVECLQQVDPESF